MFTFLLFVHALIAAALVTVILMQQSEGGGLGMGGSPSGLMSARGAADLLTKATSVLAATFVGMSIVLAVLAATHRTSTVDTSLARSGFGKPVPQAAPASATPLGATPARSTPVAPPANGAVPLAQ